MKTIFKGGMLVLGLSGGVALAEPARFDTPEAAVAALTQALEKADKAAVLSVFGAESEDVLSTGDAEKDRQLWRGFLDDLHEVSHVELEGEDRAVLQAGRDLWPFPAALVRNEGAWSFDAEGAREEILARRIGHNELAAIEILRRVGDIQAVYRRADHDGDGVMEFAASILSSPGARDGLYWPDEPGTEPSPLDGFLARASSGGYRLDGEDRDPEPYEGYYFRILQGQGEAAPGGAYSYMVAGNMVAGHALIAYPAVYGDTGVMSFLVGERGVIYEADLGEETLTRAQAIELFDPGADWSEIK